ncbi:MAG: hypothetical protein Q8N89_01380 [Azonexus sp.]|nr:hypothetical protein [Azonexus sp.]
MRILDAQAVIATHPRSYDRQQQIEMPEHLAARVADKQQASTHRGTDQLVQAVPASQALLRNIPGYDTPTFTLIPVGYTSQRPAQVSGFDDIGHLTPLCRLVSASCSSGQRFASGFLQIRSYPRHSCRSANSSPCRASRGLSPPSECALPGAPEKGSPEASFRTETG